LSQLFIWKVLELIEELLGGSRIERHGDKDVSLGCGQKALVEMLLRKL